MRGVAQCLIAAASLSGWACAAGQSRPRGVSPEFAKFYKGGDKFSCITNPSIVIPFSRVNDDFCDCPDGSDEPGTPACAYLSSLNPSTPADIAVLDKNKSLALPGFYCKNKGHQPSYIPFTNVNDGVCDYEWCCDGGDEYDNLGGVKCPDKCAEIGKAWKKKEDERLKNLAAAAKKRKGLVTEAEKLRKEVEQKVENLTLEIASKEGEVHLLETQVKELERKEKGRIVKATGRGGKLSVLVALAKSRVEELRTRLVDLRSTRDSITDRVVELEGILAALKTDYNPNFNDEGVKRAVRAWEDYAARDTDEQDKKVESVNQDLDEIVKPDSETGSIKWEDYEGEEEDDIDLLYSFEEYLPPSLRVWVDAKLRDLRIILIENGILAAPKTSGAESSQLTNLRNDLSSAQNTLTSLQTQLTTNKDDLMQDYGPNSIFRALKGTCIKKDVGEYTYSFCFLDKTTQHPKRGGGDTNMGNYVGIEKVVVDEEVSPDGKGLGKGERYALKYENGQQCWNGPSRSTKVYLACSESEEIWRVSEEEKCVYRMDVGTASVCEPDGKPAGTTGKDEL